MELDFIVLLFKTFARNQYQEIRFVDCFDEEDIDRLTHSEDIFWHIRLHYNIPSGGNDEDEIMILWSGDADGKISASRLTLSDIMYPDEELEYYRAKHANLPEGQH